MGPVPAVPLTKLADVGPGGQRIRDAYIKSEMPTKSGRRALWHHKTDVTQSMAAQADMYIEPKAGRAHLADKYWEQRSRMLLPHRLWLPLARVAAVILPETGAGFYLDTMQPSPPRAGKSSMPLPELHPRIANLAGTAG